MTIAPLVHLPLFPSFAGTTNPALVAALEALPDYGAHDAAKRRITEALSVASPSLLSAVQARQALVQDVADSARADKPQPADLGKRAAKAADAIAHAREAVALLQDADKLLSEGRDRILSGAPAALLSHLDGQLHAALVEARACGLGGITTADAAIDAGKVDAWKTVTRLTGTTSQIRAAQQLVVAQLLSGSELHQHLTTFGQVRNYADLFPGWFDRQRGRVLSTLNGEPEFASPPWDEDGCWMYAVAHHEVDLWVPTPAQLRDAYDAARADAQRAEALEEAELLGQPLTPDQSEWMQKRSILEHQYLTR